MNRTTFSVSFFYQRTQRVASVTQVHGLIAPSLPRTTLVSKYRKFSCASFDLREKFVGGYPPTQTPTQKFKSGLSMYDSQEISSGLISLRMIFEALQSELFRLNFYSLSSKIHSTYLYDL